MIAAQWRECKLGDVIELKRGYDLPKPKRVEGNVPIISSSGESGSHNEAKAKGPGVVTGRYGTLGEVFYIEKDFWPLNTALYVKDFKGNDPRFISYFMTQLNFSGQNVAGAVPGVNRNYLHMLDVVLPKVDTQRQIADVLSTYDNLIENNNRRIAILEEMVQSLYREWFIKFRFPSHENTKFRDFKLDKIPEGWEVKTLGELVNFKRNSVKKGELSEPTAYMGLEHFPRKSLALSDWDVVTEIGSSKLEFKRGDILFGKIRPYFHKVGVAQVDGICSSDTFVLEAADKKYHALISMVTFSDEFVAHSVQTSQGTKMPRANWDVLSKYPVIIPNDDLLNIFNVVVDSSLDQLKILSAKNNNLKKQRDILLPKLILGKIRLKRRSTESNEIA